MGCHLPGADLDLVAAVPGRIDIETMLRTVRIAVPEATRVRPVLGARVPGLRLSVGALDVDLSLVATGDLPAAEAVPRRHELGDEAATTLSAVSDADALLAAASGTFADLARPVKAWARARGLDAAPFGGLPGLAWTLLAVSATRDTPASVSSREVLGRFFAKWAAWDWHDAVGLTPAAATGPMTVMTPSSPHRNCAGQVGPGMRDLIAAELYRAWEIVEEDADPLPRLLAPPPMHRRHAAWAVVGVEISGAAEFETVLGRVRGRMRSLITALEESGVADVHAWPRPFETGPTHARFAIGLGSTPPDAAALSDVTVRWAGGGEIPTLR
jgi:poly(A) polymerase Pap1